MRRATALAFCIRLRSVVVVPTESDTDQNRERITWSGTLSILWEETRFWEWSDT